MVDAIEAFESILSKIHADRILNSENSAVDSDICEPMCMSHKVFGASVMQQMICKSCRCASEPVCSNNFLNRIYATELVDLLHSPQYPNKSFGELVGICTRPMSPRCPDKNISCIGPAETLLFCIMPPPVIAISVSWRTSCEVISILDSFLNCVSYRILLGQLYNISSLSQDSMYALKGFICYYGQHYVAISIFLLKSLFLPVFILLLCHSKRKINFGIQLSLIR